MTDFVIWMDSEKAQIFSLNPEGIEKTHLEKHAMDHHTHKKKDNHSDPNTDHFFKDLSTKIATAEKVLLLGPGLGKNHFRSYLEKHSPGLAKKIIGVESVDHPTENQIMAKSREFFKTYNLFNRSIGPN